MLNHALETMRFVAALLAGGAIGLAFGAIQNFALRRNEKLQQSGNFGTGMSGSMRRVAYLLVALILIQIVCPLLFDGTQWWVSGGVIVGYGAMLFRRLKDSPRP